MKKIKLFSSLIILMISTSLISCSDKPKKIEEEKCYSGRWCDTPTGKSFYQNDVYVYSSFGGSSRVFLDFDKNSEIFRIYLSFNTTQNYYNLGNSGDNPIINILDRNGRKLEKVQIQKKTKEEIFFKSNELKKSFNENGGFKLEFEQPSYFGSDSELRFDLNF